MAAVYLTTTGTQNPVIIGDMGALTFPHPTVNYDLLNDVTEDEIQASSDLQLAIDSGWVTLIDDQGDPILITQDAGPHRHPMGDIDPLMSGDPAYYMDGSGNWSIPAGGGAGNTLDMAYDQGGAGVGRAIVADAGAVTISNAVADATNALEISRTVGTGVGLIVDGGAIFNEVGADADFRVESTGDPRMLLVDAGTDTVGIGTATIPVGYEASLLIHRGTSTLVPGGMANECAEFVTCNDGGANTRAVFIEAEVTNDVTCAGFNAFARYSGTVAYTNSTGLRAGRYGVRVNSDAAVAGTVALEIRAYDILSGTATVSEGRGIYLGDGLVNAGSAVNQYGIYMEDLVSATNNYAIRTGLGLVSFGDDLDVQGDATINGKLTVTGLIDPTGIKFTEQAADPGATAAGEGTIWVRDDAPTVPVFTDDTGVDWQLGGVGATAQLVTFDTVALAETATGYLDQNLCYVVETESIYRYEATGAAYTRDATYILNTGDVGNTRWLAIAGTYVFQTTNVNGSLVIDGSPATFDNHIHWPGPGSLLTDSGFVFMRTAAGGGQDAWFAMQAMDSPTHALALFYHSDNTTPGTYMEVRNGVGTTIATFEEGGNFTVENGDTTLNGNLHVTGTTTTIESETVKVADNHLYMNDGYTTAVAQTGGLVVNYLPTAVTDTVAAGGFTAGVAATSDPTIATTGVATFALGDLVQVSVANEAVNNGIYEVFAHAANVLTLRGIGLNSTVEDFTQNQLTTDTTVAGTITQVNVSVIRAGTDGAWEVGQGLATPLAFTDLALASGGNTLDMAYDQGGVGVGRTITADTGAVQINNAVADATSALELDRSVGTGYALDVTTGAINIPTTASLTDGSVHQNGSRLLHTYGTDNLFLGRDSGNYALTGGSNTGVGADVLPALTTGSNNTAVGDSALIIAQTASTCVAIGGSALRQSVGSSGSVAVGYEAFLNGATIMNGVALGNGAGRGGATAAGIRNVAIGNNALYSYTSSAQNVAVGYNAMREAITGGRSVAIGCSALQENEDASYNIAIGHQAMMGTATTPTGEENVAIGRDTLLNYTTAMRNTAVGYRAAYQLVSGENNTLVGNESGFSLDTASYNVLLGRRAGYAIDTGQQNTLVGNNTGYALTNNMGNVLIGHNSGYSLTRNFSTFVGYDSGSRLTNAANNAFFGYQAGRGAPGSANYNVGMGHAPLINLAAGDHNIAIGYFAASTLTTANNNVAVGSEALRLVDVGSDNTAIGYHAGNTLVGGARNVVIGSNAGAAWAAGTSDSLIVETATGILIAGDFAGPWIGLSGATAAIGTEIVTIPGETYIGGKLTVTGLIDPTGIKFGEQAADPGATGAGEGTVWVRDDAPNTLMFTDDAGTDWAVAGAAITPVGDIPETPFAAANNQAAAADVTGLVFANASVRSFKAEVSVYINATGALYEKFTLEGVQRGANWVMSSASVGDTSNFVFSITTAGQVQYTSGNEAGWASTDVRFRAITTSV